MCRLLAYASAAPVSLEQMIGHDQDEAFRSMARLHDDGWGTAWVEDCPHGPKVRRKRTSRAAYDDERLPAMMTRASRARIFHLRLATESLAVTKRNSHPFKGDGLAFAHNGSIAPTSVLRAMAGPAVLEDVKGTTDSELYFALVREGYRQGLPLPEAVAAAVRRIRTAYPDASLNSLTLSPTQMVIVAANSHAPAPTEHFAAVPPEILPREHDHRYYRMRRKTLADGSFVVASAGLDEEGWEELPADSVTCVSLRTMEVTTLPLTSAPVGPYAMV